MAKINHNLRVAIIGAGNIGKKRAEALQNQGQDAFVGVFDINSEAAAKVAAEFGAKSCSSPEQVVNDPKIDAVILAATPAANFSLALKALDKGKHVLAEKPLGSTLAEAKQIQLAVKKSGKILKVGYNHRYHPALAKAWQLCRAGKIGKILYIRGLYGHGARPGYDKEWRMQKKLSSGGELLDQGVHLIDLANWFVGDFTKAFALTENFYWQQSPFEDNAFCQLINNRGQIVSFQVSLTQWKNKFLFEIFGDKGYLIIDGLGRSYGLETLTLGTKVGLGQIPKEQVRRFDQPDNSWEEEWEEFRRVALKQQKPRDYALENADVCRVLEGLYVSAKAGKIVDLKK